MLSRQHARIAALLADVFDRTGPARLSAVRRLTRYSARHEAAERAFVHPLGLAAVPARGTVRRRLVEEEEIDVAFGRLEEMAPDSVDFLIALGLLEEAALSHGRAEEALEVAALEDALPEPVLAEAADRMDIVDRWPDGPGDDLTEGTTATTYSALHRRAATTLAARSR